MNGLSRLLRFVGVGPRASISRGETTDLENPALWLSEWALGRKTASGEPVTEATALGLSAYFACLRNGAEDVAKLPRQLRRARSGRRGSDLLTERPQDKDLFHPLVRLLKRPNPIMPWGVFAQVMQHRRMGWGNAYAEIVRDGMGNPVELWPIHSSRVRTRLKKDGRMLVYGAKFSAWGFPGWPGQAREASGGATCWSVRGGAGRWERDPRAGESPGEPRLPGLQRGQPSRRPAPQARC